LTVKINNRIRQERRGSGIVNATRADFMQSTNPLSSKGKANDPTSRQRPGIGVSLTDREVSDLYETNQIFQNIIDIPAEDATRDWIDFEDTEETTKAQLEKKLTDLNAQAEFKQAITYERLRGDGFISIGLTESGYRADEYFLDKPIVPANVVNVDYLNAFSRLKISGAELDDDVYSKNFGQIGLYTLKGSKGNMKDRKVHPDRLIHLQTRKVEDKLWGIPMVRSLYDPLLIFDNASWSIGQIFYSLVFKVLQSPDIRLDEVGQDGSSQRQKVLDQLEMEFNTLTLALIGENDKLTFAGPTAAVGQGIEKMLDFVWEFLAGAARMPKAHILGQQQGTITGGQYDSLNYYARIAGMQENFLRKPLEKLIRLLFLAKDSGVGNGGIDPLKSTTQLYKLKFKPLWRLDSKTDAEIRKLIAETDKIYASDIGAITSDEVRKIRFKADPLEGVLEANPDVNPDDLDELNKKVEEARKSTGATEGAA
jgi:phage-related protein (TIGR01555 family)